MENSQVKDVKLTPELKEKLKGFLGFTKDPTFLYTPKVYREKGDDGEFIIPKAMWPVFKLKGKTGIEIANDEDNAGYLDPGTNRLHITTGKQRLELLKQNIIGWKNFVDENGDEVTFTAPGGELYKTVLQRIPAPLQRELHEAINEQSRLNEEELQGLEF